MIANKLVGAGVDPRARRRRRARRSSIAARERDPARGVRRGDRARAATTASAPSRTSSRRPSRTVRARADRRRVLAANPGQVEAYRGGKEGLLGFFVGQVMKETSGKADPRVVNELLRAKLGDDYRRGHQAPLAMAVRQVSRARKGFSMETWVWIVIAVAVVLALAAVSCGPWRPTAAAKSSRRGSARSTTARVEEAPTRREAEAELSRAARAAGRVRTSGRSRRRARALHPGVGNDAGAVRGRPGSGDPRRRRPDPVGSCASAATRSRTSTSGPPTCRSTTRTWSRTTGWGHDLGWRTVRGEGDTESLRQAIVHYRALFAELVKTHDADERDARRTSAYQTRRCVDERRRGSAHPRRGRRGRVPRALGAPAGAVRGRAEDAVREGTSSSATSSKT